MRFKIDENLKVVSAAMAERKEPATIAVELLDRFVESGMVENEVDWGRTIIEITGPQYISDVCEILAGYLYGDKAHSIDSDVFRAFCRLVVVGDGNCPVCGGDLRFEMVDGCEKLDDGDYFTPPSYSDDGYFVYVCEHCWETIKSEYEL